MNTFAVSHNKGQKLLCSIKYKNSTKFTLKKKSQKIDYI